MERGADERASSLAAVKARQRSSALLTACFGFDLEQLIAKTGRGLEVKIGRGVAHLRFQLDDQCRQVLTAVMRARLGHTPRLLLLPFLALAARISDTGNEAHLIYTLLHADRSDSMLDVVRPLDLAPAVGLLDAALHGARHLVGIKDRTSTQVSRCASDGLDQRSIAAQESFLIGVQNRNKRDLRQIEPFP